MLETFENCNVDNFPILKRDKNNIYYIYMLLRISKILFLPIFTNFCNFVLTKLYKSTKVQTLENY